MDMSESYQVYMLFPDGVERERAVKSVHEQLLAMGDAVEVGDYFYLNDLNDDEDRDVLELNDIDDALNKIIGWPTCGWVEYYIYHISLTISFHTQKPYDKIYALSIGISVNFYNKMSKDNKESFKNLIRKLHDLLDSKHTIMGTLDGFGFDWENEISKLRNNEIEGGGTLILI